MAASMRGSPSYNSPPTRLELVQRLAEVRGDAREQRIVHAALFEVPERLHHIFHIAAGLALAAE